MQHLPEINIDDYDYPLPDNRIAKYPVEPRDNSKLLVYKKGEIATQKFQSLAEHLPKNAHLIFNNTKVIPARLFFKKATGALIEIFLLNPVLPSNIISQVMETSGLVQWQCIIGNKKKWKGETLKGEVQISKKEVIQVHAELIDASQNLVQFTWEGSTSFAELVKAFGQIPLPPYLNRDTEKKDLETYQTVYSEFDGAVAAPTAGLHFTDDVFSELKKAQISTSFITLHVGAGTFQPVKVQNALEHHMHSEQIVFTKDFLEALAKNENPTIPIGTTSMRSLESLYWYGVRILTEVKKEIPFKIEKLYPYSFENKKLPSKKESINAILNYMDTRRIEELIGDTEIFIFPGYKFRICQGIITNFHQPKSTLLLLISALVGEDWKHIYEYADENDYRFLSYGDSSLLFV